MTHEEMKQKIRLACNFDLTAAKRGVHYLNTNGFRTLSDVPSYARDDLVRTVQHNDLFQGAS